MCLKAAIIRGADANRANADQRDHEAMVVLLVRDGPTVHSKVVCIRRQVALARLPTSQWFVHAQVAALQVAVVLRQQVLAEVQTFCEGV